MEKTDILAILNEAYFSAEPHEKETLEHLDELLPRAGVFVDVGASLGQYTAWASGAMRGGRILALEADQLRYEELERNCARWAGQTGNRIEPVFCAASESDGEATFYVTHSNVSGGLFPHRTAQPAQWHPVKVPARTLDSACDGFTPDLVKIDVEGSELRVLRGAQRILRAGTTRFLIEVHPWADPQGQRDRAEVHSFLRGFGFYPVPFHGQTLFMRLRMRWLPQWLGLWLRHAGQRLTRLFRRGTP